MQSDNAPPNGLVLVVHDLDGLGLDRGAELDRLVLLALDGAGLVPHVVGAQIERGALVDQVSLGRGAALLEHDGVDGLGRIERDDDGGGLHGTVVLARCACW